MLNVEPTNPLLIHYRFLFKLLQVRYNIHHFIHHHWLPGRHITPADLFMLSQPKRFVITVCALSGPCYIVLYAVQCSICPCLIEDLPHGWHTTIQYWVFEFLKDNAKSGKFIFLGHIIHVFQAVEPKPEMKTYQRPVLQKSPTKITKKNTKATGTEMDLGF